MSWKWTDRGEMDREGGSLQRDFTCDQRERRGRRGQLLPFHDQTKEPIDPLPIDYTDYLQLVDWTGRAIRNDKRGAIAGNAPLILERLTIQPKVWVRTTKHYGRWYYRVVGQTTSIKRVCEALGQKWLMGIPLDQIHPA